uniref:Reverse transcriptase domain-containing protein n=1 Tax=Tanacetum cinerariifolium TaxID=118510 RepID=A0A6L2NC48_TANCI|nr:hypothetical protein [Tanacetum cinerariifolium]
MIVRLQAQPAGSCHEEGKTPASRAAVLSMFKWICDMTDPKANELDILDDGYSLESRKLMVEKSKEELELFKTLYHKSGIVNEGSHRVVVFKKAPPMIGYANEGEPSVIFYRDFLLTSKSRVDFGIGEMRIDLTMPEEMKDIDVMLDMLVENLEEVVSSNVKVNGMIEMHSLADTRASRSVVPYCLFLNLGLGDPKPYNSNLTMVDNTQAKALREVKDMRIQIRYQAYLVDSLILDIPIDKELTLLLGRPFLRTCRAVIDIERDIEDDMERALAMEAYFIPFKNIIIFKKLIDFLGSLPIQLKNSDWGNEGYGTYKKVEGDEAWHAKFEVTTATIQGSYPNSFIENFEKRNKHGTIEYHLQEVNNAKLKWRELPSVKGTLIANDCLGCKYEYLHDDGDIFVDYSWEEAFSIYGDVYLEWGLEFFSTMYLVKELIGLGLYKEDELNHGLFAIHFTNLEVDDKLFNHKEFWQKIGKPTSTNSRTSLIMESLMRIVHKLLVGSLVHRASSKERCQKDVWIDSMPMRSNYMLEHFAPILHHLADQSNFAYPVYKPPNVPPYPYPYVPYPHPYTYYPDMGSTSFGGDHYGAHGDG